MDREKRWIDTERRKVTSEEIHSSRTMDRAESIDRGRQRGLARKRG